jgi:biopolymer transport protein ExbD
MRRGQPHEAVEIDLAPMLEFVLNLLIFFIITTSFVKRPASAWTGLKP